MRRFSPKTTPEILPARWRFFCAKQRLTKLASPVPYLRGTKANHTVPDICRSPKEFRTRNGGQPKCLRFPLCPASVPRRMGAHPRNCCLHLLPCAGAKNPHREAPPSYLFTRKIHPAQTARHLSPLRISLAVRAGWIFRAPPAISGILSPEAAINSKNIHFLSLLTD